MTTIPRTVNYNQQSILVANKIINKIAVAKGYILKCDRMRCVMRYAVNSATQPTANAR